MCPVRLHQRRHDQHHEGMFQVKVGGLFTCSLHDLVMDFKYMFQDFCPEMKNMIIEKR